MVVSLHIEIHIPKISASEQTKKHDFLEPGGHSVLPSLFHLAFLPRMSGLLGGITDQVNDRESV
jgi:hypothetical protein